MMFMATTHTFASFVRRERGRMKGGKSGKGTTMVEGEKEREG